MAKKSWLFSIQNYPIKFRVYRLIRGGVAWFLFAAIANLMLSYLFYSPKTYLLNHKNIQLQQQLEDGHKQVKELEDNLDALRFRYNSLYSSVLGIDQEITHPTPLEPTREMYPHLRRDRYRDFLTQLNYNRDIIETRVAALSTSLDTVARLTLDKNLILQAIPTISPINKNDINYISDKFGWRIHPVHKRQIFHEGLDLSCKRNTPVYATAQGVVKRVRREAGYGRVIDIDHGFGYMTRYAHLNSIEKSVGDRVMRGELIALSGNTGISTGPHLHYEVWANGKQVDPLFYLSQDMTEQEFARIIETAQEGGDSRYNLNTIPKGFIK